MSTPYGSLLPQICGCSVRIVQPDSWKTAVAAGFGTDTAIGFARRVSMVSAWSVVRSRLGRTSDVMFGKPGSPLSM